ncbi:TIGR02391 family protein [Paraburkholderia sp. BCC1885]|uniref:TIGR02391 family protein n=1 Tax=Paraburkholderia sp. BCC1885 TaxID=2562669 RepID=UPI00164275F6|nr:TIGR02391 family protein [Paraburkholderia sp. BCC1885]
MVTRKPQAAQQPQTRLANLTPEQMRAAIPKLQRRIADLEAFNPQSIRQRFDPQVTALDTKLEDTVAGIFGTDTAEYVRFKTRGLDTAGIFWGQGELPLRDVVAGLARGREVQLTNLRTIIELFEEKLVDGGDTQESRARRAFGDLDLHPEIERASAQLFRDGHYANAVEDACKVLDLLVKMRAMRSDPSGTELMQLVFSQKNPILKFNDQRNESEKSEQHGMMFLFAGAMLALRNPRAHGLVSDHPERAVEYLSFLSMLAKSLDRTQRV